MSDPDPTGDLFIGPSEAARRLGCSREWVHTLADQGTLRMVRTPLGRLLLVADVAELAVERAAKQQQREAVPA